MDNTEELIKHSVAYLNQHKKDFLDNYTSGVKFHDPKLAFFTAGMSGIGKTEYAISLKEQMSYLLHIDTDEIREFFRPIGYDGDNSSIYQKASSKGFDLLFNHALKKNYSLILDSNFANIAKATQNVERLLKRDYLVNIAYLYDDPQKCFEYAALRETVTHRKVPLDVFKRSDTNSYKTVLAIKEQFGNNVLLDFADARSGILHENTDITTIKNTIGENYDS
jgi:hypothetical protein